MPNIWTVQEAGRYKTLDLSDLVPGDLLGPDDFKLIGAGTLAVDAQAVWPGEQSLKCAINRTIGDPRKRSANMYRVKDGLNLDDHYWLGFSIETGAGWQADSLSETIFQVNTVWPSSDKGKSRPLFRLQVVEDRFEVEQNWTDLPYKTREFKATKKEALKPGVAASTKYDIVFHQFTRQFGEDGMTEVYIDGELLYVWNGPNAYNTPNPPHVKFGLDKGLWNSTAKAALSPGDERLYYYARVKEYRGGDGFQKVNPVGTALSAPSPGQPVIQSSDPAEVQAVFAGGQPVIARGVLLHFGFGHVAFGGLNTYAFYDTGDLTVMGIRFMALDTSNLAPNNYVVYCFMQTADNVYIGTQAAGSLTIPPVPTVPALPTVGALAMVPGDPTTGSFDILTGTGISISGIIIKAGDIGESLELGAVGAITQYAPLVVPGEVALSFEGLQPGITYTARGFGGNAIGTVYTAPVIFVVQEAVPAAPTLSGIAVTSLNSPYTFQANIDALNDNDPVRKGFVIGSDPNPTLENALFVLEEDIMPLGEEIGGGNDDPREGLFELLTSQLQPGTNYHVKGFIETDFHVAYTNDLPISTDEGLQEPGQPNTFGLKYPGARMVTPRTVYLQWSVPLNGGDVSQYILSDESIGEIARLGNMVFEYQVQGLSPNTRYCFELVSKNAAGQSEARRFIVHTPLLVAPGVPIWYY